MTFFSIEIAAVLLAILILIAPALLIFFSRTRRPLVQMITASKNVRRNHTHDPEIALSQPVAWWKALLVSVGYAAIAVYVIVPMLLLALSRSDLAYFATIKSTFAAEIAPSDPADSVVDLIVDDLDNAERGRQRPAEMRLIQLTAGSDEDLSDPKLAKLVREYIIHERGPGSAVKGDRLPATEAFARLLFGGALVEPDEGQAEEALGSALNEKELKRIISSSIATADLTPTSYAQFVQTLKLRGQQNVRMDTLNDPGRTAVQRAIYGRIIDEVAFYQRLRMLFVGPIQFLTILAFYLCLMLLAGRRELIGAQELESLDRFLDESSDLASIKPLNDDRPTSQRKRILAELDIVSDKEIERERKLLDEVMKAWTEGKNSASPAVAPDLLAPSLAKLTLDKVAEVNGGLAGTAPSAADREVRAEYVRSIVSAAIERYERLLDRVSYTAIEYLIMAMPSLGFIGTVIGIGRALGSADNVVSATTPEARTSAVADVTEVLGFAFDTTLIALVVSLIAVGLKSAIRSRESVMLESVRRDINARYAS